MSSSVSKELKAHFSSQVYLFKQSKPQGSAFIPSNISQQSSKVAASGTATQAHSQPAQLGHAPNLGKSWLLLDIHLYLLPSTFVYKVCVALGHREEKNQLISDLDVALDSLLKLFILRHLTSGC